MTVSITDPTFIKAKKAKEKPRPETKKDTKEDAEIASIRKKLQQASAAWAENQKNYIDDTRFSATDDQWDYYSKQMRGLWRPALTFNRLNGVIKQIIGDYRQNKLAIKVRPAGDDASEEKAEIIAGLIRNIEATSNADMAYTHAFECCLRGGFGFFRIETRYCGDDSFDMDLAITPIANPLTVYFDPSAKLPTREDAEWCFVTETIPKETFERLYPDKETASFSMPTSKEYTDWYDADGVRVAEYFEKERYTARLAAFAPDIVMEVQSDEQIEAMESLGFKFLRERTAERVRVKWRKLYGDGILEEEALPIKYIPIVPVIGEEVNIEGRQLTRSAIFYAKDAQKTYNYMKTTAVEMAALSPKAPFMVTAKQIQGLQAMWDSANVSPAPYLIFNPDPQNPGPPQRMQPTPQPIGEVSMALGAADDIKATTGIFDASLGAEGNETSGKAILARQNQGALASMIFHDNLAKSIEYAGRILIDWIPPNYDTERVLRVLDIEGQPRTEKVNEREYDPLTGITTILNSITVGKYDIVVNAGPDFASKRVEAVSGMMELAKAYPPLMQTAGDLVVKNMDWPGAEEISERLKRTLPPQLTMSEEELEQTQAQQANQPPPEPPEVQAQRAQAERQQMEFEQKMELENRKFAFERAKTDRQFQLEEMKMKLSTDADLTKHQLKLAVESDTELKKHGMSVEKDREGNARMAEAASKPAATISLNAEDAMSQVADTLTGMAEQTAQATQAMVQMAQAQAQTVQQLSTDIAQQNQMIGTAIQQNAQALESVASAVQEQTKVARARRVAVRDENGDVIGSEVRL